jgi:rubredoxin
MEKAIAAPEVRELPRELDKIRNLEGPLQPLYHMAPKKKDYMRLSGLVRVFTKGGIVSPGDFAKIIEVAQALGSDYVHLGSRQDVLFPVLEKDQARISRLLQTLPIGFEYGTNEYQNIVSSYVTLDVMPATRWLAPHIYHYVLDSFDYSPREKINITDPMQGMVPLFTGNINFVASGIDNYWYLYIRYSELGPKPWCCPELIYGFDLAKVAKAIEEIDPRGRKLTHQEIYRELKDNTRYNTLPLKQPLKYPDTTFPYYEGMNRIGEDKYWLGLYWRNNEFTNKFLKAFCEQCLQTDIGKISFSPWKSFIIKGIPEKDRLEWEKLLGKFGINMRHSSLEMNWHLPVRDKEAQDLKQYLVRVLDQQDISTYGLTFTVKTRRHMVLFTSIVIEYAEKTDEQQPDTFNILYARRFNPNLFEYYSFARGVPKAILPALLMELSKKYYEQIDIEKGAKAREQAEPSKPATKTVYQCRQCLNVYDAAYGDGFADIPPGTSFSQLPADYCCPVCGSQKPDFEAVGVDSLS